MFSSLSSQAQKVLTALGAEGSVGLQWEASKEVEHGDLSTAVALGLAKKLGKSPREIAEKLVEGLEGHESVEKVEIAGPGYVNVWLKPAVFLGELSLVESAFRQLAPTSNDPVIIDYSQPNIAKPLGIHHILSTVLGQTLGNLYEHAGYQVIRWNYLGDWGTQFGKLAVAFERWGTKSAGDCTIDELLELYVRFHKEAEKDEELEDSARAAFRKLEQGDKELRAFWEDVVAVTKDTLGGIYKRLNVRFDLDTGESYYEDKMAPVIEEGTNKGVFKKGEKDALIAEFPEDENMPPAIVLKADGATIYLTRDLAMMKDRVERFHPQSVLFVVDVAQSLHFKQLFAIVDHLEWKLPVLEHVFFGRMRFSDKSMSTRKGNILKLEHVLDEAVARADEIIAERGDAIQSDDPKDLGEMMGIGALAYGILSQNRKMDMVFDWDKMLSFDGNSAPYIQYTHARAKSVLRKAESDGMVKPTEMPDLTTHERKLMGMLLQYSAVLEAARSEHLPHKLANYLYELCQQFNAFYNADSILQSSEPSRTLRLFLCRFTADTLKSGASLLTIRVPDRM